MRSQTRSSLQFFGISRALHFDLFFNFVDGPRGLYVECDYNTDLFDASTLERWLKHYQTLLVGIAVNPAETFGKLPILTDAEQTELTTGWNTGVEFPKQKTLHGWFEQQVEKTPAAPAVTFEGQHFTYAELNRHANQLAHHLQGLGVKPGALVGLFVERSFEIVVGILGILKAGGAYLPIDPVYPKDRLSFTNRFQQINQRLIRGPGFGRKARNDVSEIGLVERCVIIDLSREEASAQRTKWHEANAEFLEDR